MRKRAHWFILLSGASVFCAACTKEPPPPPPPPEVKVSQVIQRDVPVYIENIGQTKGSKDVEVRARVEGFLDTVNFQEGTFVKKGDLLYTIDPQPFEAALAFARGQLAQAQAQLAKASQDVARYKPLVAQNAISREQYDTSVAYEDAAKAGVEAAQAAVETAKINLSYVKVYAPVDGLVGKTEVYPGALVGRGQSTLLTTVSTIEPINARFTFSEQDYLKIARQYGAKPPPPDERREGRFELILADGSLHPHKGHLVFADRLVDPTTGTLLVEVSFPNPERIVRPGQFARVRVAVDTKRNAILVPQRAVQELQATFSVAVVSRDNKIAMRTVKPGERVGSLWVIEDGLKPGEVVVVEGLQKVRDGVTVKPTTVEIKGD